MHTPPREVVRLDKKLVGAVTSKEIGAGIPGAAEKGRTNSRPKQVRLQLATARQPAKCGASQRLLFAIPYSQLIPNPPPVHA